ncbi:MAG: PUA domain-containing protein [Candidatus Hodarchaeota archaeon]
MAISLKSRNFLSKKLIKVLNADLLELYGEEVNKYFSKNAKIEEAKLDNGGAMILIDRKPYFYKKNEKEKIWIPFIDVAREIQMKKVQIDQPAVPYITDGADVMRPGIVDLDEFEKDDFVAIIDEKNQLVLAIGRAMYSSKEIEKIEKGKVIKIIHHAGDRLYNLRRSMG